MNRAGRIKTTYIVLSALVVLLSLYLILRSGDRIQYVIPRLNPLGAIDEVEILQSGETIRLVFSGERWKVQPEGFNVDPDIMIQILEIVGNLKFSELVSVTGNYGAYDLDDSSRIQVAAFKGGELIRSFNLGKRSPTYDHTFIKLADDDRVFQVSGDIRYLFGNTKEGFRDKTVFTMEKGEIKEIRIEKPGKTLTLNLNQDDSSWKEISGEVWDSAKVDNVLDILSQLTAFGFRDPDDPDGDPIFSITIIGNGTHTITFYEKRGNLYPVRSSQSDFPFNLFYAISENIFSIGER